jgi:hypothetical protein
LLKTLLFLFEQAPSTLTTTGSSNTLITATEEDAPSTHRSFQPQQARYYCLPFFDPSAATSSSAWSSEQFASADDDPTATVVDDLLQQSRPPPINWPALILANPYLADPALPSILMASSMISELRRAHSYAHPWSDAAQYIESKQYANSRLTEEGYGSEAFDRVDKAAILNDTQEGSHHHYGDKQHDLCTSTNLSSNEGHAELSETRSTKEGTTLRIKKHRLPTPTDDKTCNAGCCTSKRFRRAPTTIQPMSSSVASSEYSNNVLDSCLSADADEDDASTSSSTASSYKNGSQRRKDVLWTQEEDELLTTGLEALFTSDAWISKHGDKEEGDSQRHNACISNEEWESVVQNYLDGKRNVRQCRRRWARMKKLAQSKPPPKQGERWTAEEDETLRVAVLQEKHVSPRFKWSLIARKYFKDTRSSEQCRTRWNVRVKHPDWTPKDDALILSMRDAGESWAEISKCFPSRPTVTVKRRWVKLDADRKLSADPLWGGWSPEEIEQLVSALAKAGDIHWTEVERLPENIRNHMPIKDS